MKKYFFCLGVIINFIYADEYDLDDLETTHGEVYNEISPEDLSSDNMHKHKKKTSSAIQLAESATSIQKISSGILPEYYIASNNYTQSTFANMFYMSTWRPVSNQAESKGFWAHTFEDGAWNLFANAGSLYVAMPAGEWASGIGYSTTLWGQTGRSAGFALGGSVIVGNIGTSLFNTSNRNNQTVIPTSEIYTIPQAYVDYQYDDKFDILVGNIIINNPFMQSDVGFPGAVSVSPASFTAAQGQWQPNRSTTFTLLRSFLYKPIDKNGFNGDTLYNNNYQFNQNLAIFQNLSQASPGVLAAGMQLNPNSSAQIDGWLYQMYDYVNIAYTDMNYNWNPSSIIGLSMAVQAAAQQANGADIIGQQTSNSYGVPNGSPQSNVVGTKFTVSIDSWNINAAYNQFWGSGFGNGGFISPYTVYQQTDPFYTTSWATGMVQTASAGGSYKFGANTSFFDHMLTIMGSYASYLTANSGSGYPNSGEYDLGIQYRLPNVRNALIFYNSYTYVTKPDSIGGNSLGTTLWVSYGY